MVLIKFLHFLLEEGMIFTLKILSYKGISVTNTQRVSVTEI